jgi:alpha-tubulin suppressor-like RCC1 family protein
MLARGARNAALSAALGLGLALALAVVSWTLPAQAEPASVQVSAGYDVTCARKIDATAWCWGFDGTDSLGNGDPMLNDSSSPVAVINVGAGVAEVTTGQYHACARKTDGSAWCWGYDADGELGDNTTNGHNPPTQVFGLTNVVQINAGYLHTCARKGDGTLWCWGSNAYGQLGDGTFNNQSAPEQVTALGTSVADFSAGLDHTCARLNDGTVWCWGNNFYGQLGDGTTMGSTNPIQVSGITSAVEVSVNNGFSCARKADRTTWCWGGNTDGELGVGTTANSSTPVQVTGIGSTTAQISAGDNGACAVLTDGSLWCWGANFDGNLGDGTTTRQLSPVQVTATPFAHNVAEVSMGVHTCARTTDGKVWCWGHNSNGQLGNGNTTSSPTPVLVPITTGSGTVVPPATPALGPAAAAALALMLMLAGLKATRPEPATSERTPRWPPRRRTSTS